MWRVSKKRQRDKTRAGERKMARTRNGRRLISRVESVSDALVSTSTTSGSASSSPTKKKSAFTHSNGGGVRFGLKVRICARSLVRHSLVRSLARSLARSFARSLARSLVRWLAGSLARCTAFPSSSLSAAGRPVNDGDAFALLVARRSASVRVYTLAQRATRVDGAAAAATRERSRTCSARLFGRR